MSDHTDPIVSAFFTVGTQPQPYQAPPLTRYDALYHTQITVRGQPEQGKPATVQQNDAYCLPDAASWERTQATHATFQQALAALGDALRQLGTYRQRLEEAGGIKKAPNPLTPTVIAALEPDRPVRWWYTAMQVPSVTRVAIERHTPEMLREKGKDYTGANQRDHLVCPSDGDWRQVKRLYQAAVKARHHWEALVKGLGTYRDALADGRYGGGEQRSGEVVPMPSPKDFPYGSLVIWTRADGTETLGRVTTNFSGKKLALCVPPESAMPRYVDPARCRPAKEEPVRITEATTTEPSTAPAHNDGGVWHNLPPLLSDWKWDGMQKDAVYPPPARLRAPDGYQTAEYERSNHAIAEALRHVHSQQATQIVPQPATSGALSAALQDCALRYVAAREQAGAALLDMAAALAQARQQARHGEWYAFLEAIGTSEDQADRLLDIHDQAERNPAFADAVRRNFLNPTTAALLARSSTPPAVVERVLQAPEPPSTRQVEQQIREARGVETKSRSAAGNEPAPAVAVPKSTPPPSREYMDAQRRADRLGLDLRMTDAGGFVLTRIDNGAAAGGAVSWSALLDLLDREQQASTSAAPPPWICEACNQPQTGMKEPTPPVCTNCAMARLNQALVPAAPETPPAPALPAITISTSEGPVGVRPTCLSDHLALHPAIKQDAYHAWTITHRPTGKLVAGFAKEESATAAFAELDALDWSLVTNGESPLALTKQIVVVLARYDDEIYYEQRVAAVQRMDMSTLAPAAAIAPAAIPAGLVVRASHVRLNVWTNPDGGYTSANSIGAASYRDHATLEALEAYIASREQPAAPVPPADDLKAQARAKFEPLLRIALSILRTETIVLRLIALGICDRDQRGLVAELPLEQLHDLLIGRLFAGAWSIDPAPLLALLGIEAGALEEIEA